MRILHRVYLDLDKLRFFSVCLVGIRCFLYEVGIREGLNTVFQKLFIEVGLI